MLLKVSAGFKHGQIAIAQTARQQRLHDLAAQFVILNIQENWLRHNPCASIILSASMWFPAAEPHKTLRLHPIHFRPTLGHRAPRPAAGKWAAPDLYLPLYEGRLWSGEMLQKSTHDFPAQSPPRNRQPR